MDRIAEYADGWLPTNLPELEKMISQLQAACEARGRDIAEIDITAMGEIQSQETLSELQALGVNRVVIGMPPLDEDRSLDLLDQQARVVEWAKRL